MFPSLSGKIVKIEGDFELVNDGWGRIIRRKKNGFFSQTVQRVLENYSDLERVVPEPAGLDSRFENFNEAVSSAIKRGSCVFAKAGGLYCRGQFVRGEENLLVDMLAERNFCNDFFDLLLEHATRYSLEILKRGDLWKSGLFVYDDMACSRAPNFSPELFEEFFLPRYSKMISKLEKAGCSHVFFHSDGNIEPFLDLLIESGFEGFQPS